MRDGPGVECPYRSMALKHNSKQQKGSALIISLIILLALTMIGVSGMRSTTMEEKMSGAMRDKAIAFQAAEAALKRGEQFFQPLVGTGGFDGSGGQYGPTDDEPDYFDSATWTDSNSFSYTDAITNVTTPSAFPDVAEQPRYILKYVSDMEGNATSLNMGGYGQQKSDDISDFMITARGVGPSGNSVVIIRAFYGKQL